MRHTRRFITERLYDQDKSRPFYRTTIYQRAIAFVDRGTWRDITFKVHPRTNLFDGLSFGFDEMITGGFPVKITKGGILYRAVAGKTNLIVSIPDALDTQAQQIENDWILYENALPNADIRVKNAGHRIPVEIDLKRGHPSSFRFRLNLNLAGRLMTTGHIQLPTGVLPRPTLKFPQSGVIVARDYKEDIVLEYRIERDEIVIDLPDGDYAGWVLDPTYTTQPGAALGIDSNINEQAPNTNYGADTTLRVTHNAGGDNRDSLIRFDMSPVPIGSTVTSWEIDLYRTDRQLNTPADMRAILNANSGWTELGATWNTLNGADAWAGGAGPGDNLGVAVAATAFYTSTDSSTWPAVPAHVLYDSVPNYGTDAADLTAFQAMFDDYSGLFFRDRTRGAAAAANHTFDSSDSVTAAQRPKLTLDYTLPSAQRLAAYTYNIWDPEARILDSFGNVVPPNELRADRWMSVLGVDLPTGKQYTDFVDSPSKTKLVSVDVDTDGARIVSNPNEFADVIIKRAGAGI